MPRWIAVVELAARFLWAVPVSGAQTVLVILRGRQRPPAAFVRMRFAPMSEAGAAILGCLITLTPGTTTIDIDMERRELLLHLLDASAPDEAIAGIRHAFERHLVTIFGRNRE